MALGSVNSLVHTDTHGRFQPDVRTFLKRWVAEGPTHHFALGVGHHAVTLDKIANLPRTGILDRHFPIKTQ